MIYILFEQSGTFKNEFKKLGYTNVLSIDIENRFNETDVQIDIFEEINNYFDETKPSMFYHFKKGDLVLAFFPCTYFSGQNKLIFSGKFKAFRNWTNEKINDYINNRSNQRNYYLSVLDKLVTICKERDLKLIIENPYKNSYLLNINDYNKPSLIIQDRTKLGDNRVKPTMFYFFNLEVKNHDIELWLNDYEIKTHNQTNPCITRSLITSEFANNFIRKHILNRVHKYHDQTVLELEKEE